MLCFTFEVFLKITSKTCVDLPYGEVGGANGGEGGALQVLGPYGEDPDCRYHKPWNLEFGQLGGARSMGPDASNWLTDHHSLI